MNIYRIWTAKEILIVNSVIPSDKVWSRFIRTTNKATPTLHYITIQYMIIKSIDSTIVLFSWYAKRYSFTLRKLIFWCDDVQACDIYFVKVTLELEPSSILGLYTFSYSGYLYDNSSSFRYHLTSAQEQFNLYNLDVSQNVTNISLS